MYPFNTEKSFYFKIRIQLTSIPYTYPGGITFAFTVIADTITTVLSETYRNRFLIRFKVPTIHFSSTRHL